MIINQKWEGLEGVFASLDSAKARKGFKAGIKKVGDSVKTLSSKTIRDGYNLKKAAVDRTFSVYATDQSVTIASKGRPINLTAFDPRQYGSRGGKRVTTRRVGDTVKRGVRGKSGSFGGVVAPITRSRSTLLPGAFIARVKAGNKGAFNVGVFQRANHAMKTPYNNPYVRKTGRPYVKTHRAQQAYRAALVNKAFVTVPTLFTGVQVMATVAKYISTDAIKTVIHEINWAMGRR
jgi:hypothetical protein